MLHNQPKLFQDPQIDYPIHDLNLDFAEYIRLSKLIVQETRQDLTLNADFIISANSPFELRPTTKPHYGVLLIHGLLDSPFIMRDIGKSLYDQNMLVRAVSLPGHGTVPGALLNVSYLDWLQTVRYGIASLKNEVEKIILVGYSTGAALSLLAAALEPDLIDRIIMIAPALQISSPFAGMTNWYKTISWAWPRAQWLHVRDEIDYVKYCSVTFNSVYQVYLLAQEIKKYHAATWENHPCFMIVSNEDAIVTTHSALKFFLRYMNKQSSTLVYAAEPKHYPDSRIHARSSSYPELNIENFSHICLPVSPDNVHYGKNGFFVEASHVHSKKYIYGEEDAIDTIMHRLKYTCHLEKQQHRRLSFNPDFSYLIQSIEDFIFSSETTHQS